MNRQQRRGMEKGKGDFKYLQTPCTVAEAAQISRGVAEDVVADYHAHTGHLQISISLQLEILKELVINAGLITAEDFKEQYILRASAFNEAQKKAMEVDESPESDGDVKMSGMNVGDVAVEKEIKENVDGSEE